MKALSLRHKPFNGSSSDEGELSNSPGALTFEYFEHAPPFSREPLADKVCLSAQFFIIVYMSCILLLISSNYSTDIASSITFSGT